jgi:hypothetical protein
MRERRNDIPDRHNFEWTKAVKNQNLVRNHHPMAHYLRRPVLSPAGLQFCARFQQRPFSIASSQWAMSRAEMGQQPRQQSERSAKVVAREMGKMPSDLGLLPRMPSPSPLSQPLEFQTNGPIQKPSSTRAAETHPASSARPAPSQSSTGSGSNAACRASSPSSSTNSPTSRA